MIDFIPSAVLFILPSLAQPTIGSNDAALDARLALEQMIPDFKLRNFNFLKSTSSLTGRHFYFQEMVGNVPVWGSMVVAHGNNSLFAYSSQLAARVPLVVSVEPRFSENSAVESFRRFTNESIRSELVVLPLEQSRLAWKLETLSRSGANWRVFLDAQTGQWIDSPQDINRYHKGRIFPVSPLVSLKRNDILDDNGNPDAVPENAYVAVDLLELDSSGFLNGKYASSRASKKQQPMPQDGFVFKRGSPGFNETMGYFYFTWSQALIQSLGFDNINNRQVKFAVDRLTDDNSFYSPSTKEISFGTGGVDDAEDAEVVLHELGHAIQDNQVEDYGSTLEGGAMGEGFGDYFAASALSIMSGGYQDTCIAEWDAVSYSRDTPPCLRRVDTKKVYPKDLERQVHADGEIWSGTLWDLTLEFGRERILQVVLESHFYLTSASGFKDGAKAVKLAAEKLEFSQSEMTKLIEVMAKRGL